MDLEQNHTFYRLIGILWQAFVKTKLSQSWDGFKTKPYILQADWYFVTGIYQKLKLEVVLKQNHTFYRLIGILWQASIKNSILRWF